MTVVIEIQYLRCIFNTLPFTAYLSVVRQFVRILDFSTSQISLHVLQGTHKIRVFILMSD